MASVQPTPFRRFADGNIKAIALVCIFLYSCNRILRYSRLFLYYEGKIVKNFAFPGDQDGCFGHVIQTFRKHDVVW